MNDKASKATTMGGHVAATTLNPPAPCAWYRGDNYVVQDSVGFMMSQIVLAMRREIELRMAKHELTAAQWHPLWLIKTQSATTPQEIARALLLDAGSVSRMLDRLEAKQLVRRNRSQTDRRVVNLELTEAGAAVLENVPQVLAEVNNVVLTGFSKAEWQQLSGLLMRVLGNARALQSANEVTP